MPAKHYSVFLTASAEKELKKLSSPVITRIVPHLENLAINPRPPRCKKLTNGDKEWRIRIGDYRAIYTIDDSAKIIEVTRIAHRSAVYE